LAGSLFDEDEMNIEFLVIVFIVSAIGIGIVAKVVKHIRTLALQKPNDSTPCSGACTYCSSCAQLQKPNQDEVL
jgi:hypothetical protein